MRKKIMLAMMILSVVALVLVGCSGKSETSTEPAGNEEGNEKEQVTLRFFSANPDRTTGIGKVEQELINRYMEENPHVKVEVEALQDEPYKNKILVYSSMNDLPDILHTWGQASFINPLIENGLLAELNPDDFKDYGFVAGSFDGYSKNGKLFGLPKNADMLVLYYNKKIFQEQGLEAPKTTEELLNVIQKLREANINPVAVNGMDAWTFPIWFEYAVQRQTGDFSTMDKALAGEGSFTSPEFIKAAEEMKALVDEGMFQNSFLTADYGTARNLFGQEKAAMYLMGSWEMSLAADENFPQSFRDNVAVIPYPSSSNSSAQDVAAWYGGGYSISNHSKHKEEAIALLKYMFKPENWAKTTWQTGAGIPAQNFDAYLTGQETVLQKELISIFNSIKTSSGTPVLDDATPEFKQAIMDAHQLLFSGEITPQQFVDSIQKASENR